MTSKFDCNNINCDYISRTNTKINTNKISGLPLHINRMQLLGSKTNTYMNVSRQLQFSKLYHNTKYRYIAENKSNIFNNFNPNF